MANNSPKLITDPKPQSQELCRPNTKQDENQKCTQRPVILQLPAATGKEKVSGEAREKPHGSYEQGMKPNFSRQTMPMRRQWRQLLKVLKAKRTSGDICVQRSHPSEAREQQLLGQTHAGGRASGRRAPRETVADFLQRGGNSHGPEPQIRTEKGEHQRRKRGNIIARVLRVLSLFQS